MRSEIGLRVRPDDLNHSKSGLADVENGNGARRPPDSSATTTVATRWKCTLCLLATFFVVVHNVRHSNIELQSMATRVQNKINGRDHDTGASYEPLVGARGGIFDDLRGKRDAGVLTGKGENPTRCHDIIQKKSPSSRGKRSIHPRVACFVGINEGDPSSCPPFVTNRIEFTNHVEVDKKWPSSIPKSRRESGKRSDSASDSKDFTDLYASETEECKLSDPSYQAVPAAPSTCNDIHALGFRFGPSESEPISGLVHIYPSRHKIKYLTSGGFRSVWTVTQLDEAASDPRVIMKTNQLKRGWSSYYLDQNRRDILISERAGKSIAHSNLLPVHQYCAFSSVVPFATAGPLDDYLSDRMHARDIPSAVEQYRLAMMAARGLREAHIFRDGRATMAHADVKPPQFLLFDRPPRRGGNDNNATTAAAWGDLLPIMQINDFNRGKFLTRSVESNETCPFQMCHVHHKGSLFRSPEEYMECADQSDRIDVFSLGGVFYYILSDGEKPWYYVKSYQKGVDAILRGEHPRLPGPKEYEHYGENNVAKVHERSKHPLHIALKDVMRKCWAFEPKDRPSSMQVVQMLEEKWREIYLETPETN